MKKIILLFFIAATACTKENSRDQDGNHPPVIPPIVIPPVVPVAPAEKWVGGYTVKEDTYALFGSFFQHTEFSGKIIKTDSNKINLIQSARTPRPAWIEPVLGNAIDSMPFLVKYQSDTLQTLYCCSAAVWGTTGKKDTIRVHYIYGTSTFVYDIYQTWIK